MQHLQPNTTLQGGKYRIERVLGQGGFGITYLARNTVFDIDVAIKEFFMKDENERDGNSVTMPNSTKTELFEGQKEKFKKEAKRMFAIKNEHIIGVHDLFEENGTAYYVMDYVDGENLSERLMRKGKPMPEQDVREILPQILDALKSVHDAGIWHLDLKPANILIDKSGNVKLIDFGASKQMDAQKGGATTSTAISYTNGYAPREQMEQNYDKFGPWTDIYALGATLYTLLTNKRPPLPTDIDDDASDNKHQALPFPDNVSDEIKCMVLYMMKTNRNQRPQKILDLEIILSATPTKDDEETILAPTIFIKDNDKEKELFQYYKDKNKKNMLTIEEQRQYEQIIIKANNPLELVDKDQIVWQNFKEARIRVGDKFIDVNTGNYYLEEYEDFPQFEIALKKRHYYLWRKVRIIMSILKFWGLCTFPILALLFIIDEICKTFSIKLIDFEQIFNCLPLFLAVPLVTTSMIGFFLLYVGFIWEELQNDSFSKAEEDIDIDFPEVTREEFINRGFKTI